jgi:RNA polymerase sigma-70 factor, ECF subfamily
MLRPGHEHVAETVRRARAGDADAIDVLARRALKLALRTSVATLGSRDEAADIAQETAIDALRDLGSLREPELFDAWVYRIAARRTLRHLTTKRGRRRREAPLHDLTEDEMPATPSGEGARVEQMTIAPAVRAALLELPPRERLALALHYVAGFTDSQIADALGCGRGTVGSLLSRGRASLQANPLLAELRPSRLQGEC